MYSIQEINAAQLRDLMENEAKSFRLVDVRNPAEMAQGVLPGAESVPMHLVPLRLEEWREASQRIVFYCRSGARSRQVCAFLQQQGMDRVLNLRGGIIDWFRQGFPIAAQQASSQVG